MPIYEYQCSRCKNVFELFNKMGEGCEAVCPKCMAPEGLLRKAVIEETDREERRKEEKIFVGFGSCRTPAGRTSTLTTPKYLGM